MLQVVGKQAAGSGNGTMLIVFRQQRVLRTAVPMCMTPNAASKFEYVDARMISYSVIPSLINRASVLPGYLLSTA